LILLPKRLGIIRARVSLIKGRSMQVYAPISPADLKALKCAIQAGMPPKLDQERQKQFSDAVGTLVALFQELNDAPRNYLGAVAHLRTFFSRLFPWDPTLRLLAKARGESTQALYRALRAARDVSAVKGLGLFTADGQVQPIVHQLDGQQPRKAAPDGEPCPEDLAFGVIQSKLAESMSSVSADYIAQQIERIVDSRFGAVESDELEELLAKIVNRYGFKLTRRE
jgi:hypothetical protein